MVDQVPNKNILVKTVRVAGFRGLENIQVDLEQTTVLTGMNNTGKTSFLKALQVALGNRQFLSQDDFFIKGHFVAPKITIDVLIAPVGTAFSDDWEILFTEDRIRTGLSGDMPVVPLRTVVSYDEIKNSYKTTQYILPEWPDFVIGTGDSATHWFAPYIGKKTSFSFDELPFFYMDAQRDILNDTKLRSSYLGRMLANIDYSEEDIASIEGKIGELNDKAVNSSKVLSNLRTHLKGLNSTLNSEGEGVEITPFTKKIRDLNKGLTIYYTDQQESFAMENHGMGTRSWSSLLTLKAFISWLEQKSQTQGTAFFPVLAIEEPESHLHPNAQKRLYGQINDIPGQKIISTHSPYIAAAAGLNQVRHFFKDDTVICTRVNVASLKGEEQRMIERHVINCRGEIFFSRAIIFFEGETEEQALPIFAKHHFGKTTAELGIDFVGVAGSDAYKPFLIFAESLRIPWLIFSDAEPPAKAKVPAQVAKCGSTHDKSDCIVFLDDGYDFEIQLIQDGYRPQFIEALMSFEKPYDDADRRKKLGRFNRLSGDDLIQKIQCAKARFAPAIAKAIVASGSIPPKVLVLFQKLRAILGLPEDST